MSFLKILSQIMRRMKPHPAKLPTWIETADMTFQDNTWDCRQWEDRNQRMLFPKNRRNYVLDANDNDGESVFFQVGLETIDELCKGRTVLTSFKTYGTPAKKLSPPPETFPHKYYHVLRKVCPAEFLFAKNDRELSILSTGFHHSAYSAFQESRESDNGFVETVTFYLFSEQDPPVSAEDAQKLAETNQDELRMHFHEWPDELHFSFDPQNVDVRGIWFIIQQVCQKHDLVVTHPLTDSME